MKFPTLWMAAVLLLVSGCSNHWLSWGNADSGYGEAHLHRYDSEPGAGSLSLSFGLSE